MSTDGELRIFGVTGIGEIAPRDDLAGIIATAVADHHGGLLDGDVVVVTQKIVSKAEGQLVAVDADDPLSHKAVVEAETVRVLRRRGDLIISETKHGFICANSGVDLSNVQRGQAALLPLDSDRSARRIRDILQARLGVRVGVVVSDTFGRPWRRGLTDVAIGVGAVMASGATLLWIFVALQVAAAVVCAPGLVRRAPSEAVYPPLPD